MTTLSRPLSMRNFTLIWAGQLVSLLGSGLTSFALGYWVYQRTGSVTLFALISLFTLLPGVVLSPVAGALVDRWNRRLVMIVCDTGAGLCTLAVVLLLSSGMLDLWHIYLLTGLSALFNTFQWPAYAASVALLVPEEQLGRANGMIQLAQAVSQLLAPLLAGLLLTAIGLQGIVALDLISFAVAVSMLLLTRIPQPPRAAPEGPRSTVWADIAEGWRFLGVRPGLLAIMVLFGISNFMIGLVSVLATPLILSLSGNSSTLGLVISLASSGMLFGSLAMSAWGGPKVRIYGMYGGMLVEGLAIAIGAVQPSLVLFTVAAFVFFFALPIDAGCCQAILQSKIPPDMQGRVFALQRMIGSALMPVAYLLAGPLSDGVFEPLMAPGGALAGSVGALIGVGPGRGIALLFIVCGALYLLVTLAAFLYPRLRLVERELPDVLGDQPAPEAPRPVPVAASSDGMGLA